MAVITHRHQVFHDQQKGRVFVYRNNVMHQVSLFNPTLFKTNLTERVFRKLYLSYRIPSGIITTLPEVASGVVI